MLSFNDCWLNCASSWKAEENSGRTGTRYEKSNVEPNSTFVSSEQRFQTEITKFTRIRINRLNGPFPLQEMILMIHNLKI